MSNKCPTTGEENCSKCSGEYCETHGSRPCDCDIVERHTYQNKLDEIAKSFINKPILLSVEVKTVEEAHELLRWMYGKDKPMKATLQEISWDKQAISVKEYDALQAVKRILQ